MNEYIVKKIANVPSEQDWESANIAEINLKPWEETTYHFKSFARMLYNDSEIYVRMESDEMPVVAKQTERHSPVCTDSCMEFFFSPDTNSDLYINFEVNALGTILIGAGKEKKDRIRCLDDKEIFDVKPQLCENGWKVTFKIPFDFIKKYSKECTPQMKGNFYKCGSDTGHRHFGVWNMIETKKPDFHSPEYFGKLVFEK